MEQIQIGSSGIKKSLKKYTPLRALVEYIWNSFDAKAKVIEINCEMNELDGIQKIKIKDDGYGISRKTVNEKFTPFFESQKVELFEKKYNSAIHGKNGIGRLTFFKFADKAIWDTVYEDKNKNYRYTIKINAENLQVYELTDTCETMNKIGTSVTFGNIIGIYTCDEIKSYIEREFCWFLELNKESEYKIYLNNEEINYSNLVGKIICDKYNFKNIKFDVKYVVWKEYLKYEYSKYYFINSEMEEVMKDNTSLNNKGDKFYHSVYIKSEMFNDFFQNKKDIQIPLIGYNYASEEYVFIKDKIDKTLKNIRRPFIEKYTKKIIEDFEKENIFPNYDRSNALDNFKRNEIEFMVKSIYKAQPSIFNNLNKQQKKTFVRFLDLIMQSGEIDNLFQILEEIIDLDSEERLELSGILKRSKLSNIVKTMKLIEDRYNVIEQLKRLVFNKELKANEVKHIQETIENHYWIFGEQYHLVTAAEPKFNEALKRYNYLLTGEEKKFDIDHPDKNKEMDIFAVRQEIGVKRIKNIVVELKHPLIKLGEKELSQVKKYMRVIQKQEVFMDSNMRWEFILVGNRFDTSEMIEDEIESNKNHGESGLVYSANNCKIYVKRWAEIFSEFEIKHKFLNDKLKLEREELIGAMDSADKILEEIKQNSAVQPKEIELSKK